MPVAKGHKFAQRTMFFTCIWRVTINGPLCGMVFPSRGWAKFCPTHKRPALLLKQKLWRARKVAADPDYYKHQTPYKRAWAILRQEQKPPFPCAGGCGALLPRTVGRNRFTFCVRCRPEHRAYLRNLEYNRRLAKQPPKPLIPCMYCGTLLDRKPGRAIGRATCRACHLLRGRIHSRNRYVRRRAA